MIVVNKAMLQIKSGREKIGVGFTGLGEMKQNEDGLIYFNKKNPVYFEYLEYTFDGPVYNTVVESRQNGMSSTKGKDKSKQKGKSGKVVGGAILGTLLFPGVGTVVGAYAGGKGKNKKKGENSSVTKDSSQSIETQRQVEVPSIATLRFKNVETSEEFSIQIVCDSLKNAQLINFKTTKPKNTILVDDSKSFLDQIKEYKELFDLNIISQEEFNKKKAELLNL
ncbi:SHOCT domain-containing protein [Carnobacterium pleistocenium]|uniref:SHOCT domain-containing protein n=1 Tax=Carnobacterium pleistocenium TaxID=181073 RepID=UPI000550242F|nr:SHOCT domain-containing protein [Carnobacterium pleistocenium]